MRQVATSLGHRWSSCPKWLLCRGKQEGETLDQRRAPVCWDEWETGVEASKVRSWATSAVEVEVVGECSGREGWECRAVERCMVVVS